MEIEVDNWEEYRMDWRGDPHPVMEPLETEIEVVDDVLRELVDAHVLPHTSYDKDKFLAHRNAVKRNFDIPWTGISPRMQRLLYAFNAITQPRVMVVMGIFCGNTFISNAGAAIGPGACYRANRLVGVEIVAREAGRARENVAALDTEGQTEILAADGSLWLRRCTDAIDLLYIDADGSYLPIVKEAGRRALHGGSLVLAHNSINLASNLRSYLDYVRDPRNSKESVNIFIDDQGLEATLWRAFRRES